MQGRIWLVLFCFTFSSLNASALDRGQTCNTEGARFFFSAAPAWYQTNWFKAFAVVLGILTFWIIYRLRIQQVARNMSARFDERLNERTRIARELHDTFLQTIQGSKLIADDALDNDSDPARMRRAMEQLSVWLGQATQEGRAALNSLRTSTTEHNELSEALRRATEKDLVPHTTKINFKVLGDMKEMHPIVRDEVYRIGYEAIRNSLTHSKGSQLEVELKYAQDLSVRVRDNGVGMDPAALTKGKDEHFGLVGMKERASRIGGRLKMTSTGSGTEILLLVPGEIVFRKSSQPRLQALWSILRRLRKPARSA